MPPTNVPAGETPPNLSEPSPTAKAAQETELSGARKSASQKAPELIAPMAHKSASSKRAKPSFEIPADAGAAESAAGWVFRETQPPSDPFQPERKSQLGPTSYPAPKAAPVSSRPKTASDEVLATATEVFVLSATSVGFATLAAIRLLEVPFAAGKLILPDLKRSV